MSNLRCKKIEMELLKVAAVKGELEYKIAERLEDIQRIKDHIVLQDKRKEELMAELKELKSTK